MTQNDDAVRRRVAETYGQVATGQSGCCDATSRGVDPRVDAVVNSYGCGSPVSVSDVQPGNVVLDLGCGVGLDLLLAAKKVGSTGRAIGIDMTDEMNGRARANVTAAGLDNVDICKGIIEDVPVANGSVDWVISNCAINLSPNKTLVFAEVERVLKPGGRIRVADIVAEDLPEWVRSRCDLYDACVAGAITEDDYVAAIRAAGLEEVSVGGRFVYDRRQLADITTGRLASTTEANRVADALVGRVWSAYFSARKPRNEGLGHD